MVQSNAAYSRLYMYSIAPLVRGWYNQRTSAAESVEGTPLPLEGVDHVHGGDGLPLGVFGVGDGVADHVLEEDLEDAPGLLVDEARDPFDAAPPGEAPDSGLGDALDVVTEDLAVPLGASLAQPFAALATTSHLESC